MAKHRPKPPRTWTAGSARQADFANYRKRMERDQRELQLATMKGDIIKQGPAGAG